MPTRLQLARPDIHSFFDSASNRIYKQRDIEKILSENRENWRLAIRTTFGEFLQYLIASRKLRELRFDFPHRREIRFVWGEIPLEAVLMTLKPNCHFSHYTAMQLHDLTEQNPKTIYVNHEQKPKPISASGLQQDRIDLAFKRKPRMTRNIAKVRGRKDRVCLLNGKHTGYVGVIEKQFQLPNSETPTTLRLTGLERTLIDIAVRPFYGGGAAEILKAYRLAAPNLSINRLASTLRKLGYVYPYHQAVGFYLDASGAYKQTSIDLFHDRFDFEYDFYLTYNMEETEYVPRWRIYVPPGLSP